MSKARCLQVLEKSVAAAVSSIEVYNKPDFKYRGETFSILMINAWELLFKARILKDNGNDLRSIQVREKRRKKDGTWSSRLYLRKTRSGNPATISIGSAVNKIRDADPTAIDDRLVHNLLLLLEIRDSSIHLINTDLGMESRIQDVGTACLRNYLQLVQDWFDHDMSRYNFYLMPLSFFHESDVQSFSIKSYNEQARNLLGYLKAAETKHPSDADKLFNVTLRVETKFVRSNSAEAIDVRWTNNPDAPEVLIKEEDVLKRYPFDYNSLTAKLRSRYTDFKSNQAYHDLRKPLKSDPKYCRTRRLDPGNPKSLKKDYYSSEVFKVFDENYTKV